MTHVQHHLMGLRLRHATAGSSRTPSLAKMSAVLSVPSTSLSVSSYLRLPLDGCTPFVLVTLDVSKFRVVLSLESMQQRFVSGNFGFADWMSFVCAH